MEDRVYGRCRQILMRFLPFEIRDVLVIGRLSISMLYSDKVNLHWNVICVTVFISNAKTCITCIRWSIQFLFVIAVATCYITMVNCCDVFFFFFSFFISVLKASGPQYMYISILIYAT